jgi:hypothetical protein
MFYLSLKGGNKVFPKTLKWQFTASKCIDFVGLKSTSSMSNLSASILFRVL